MLKSNKQSSPALMEALPEPLATELLEAANLVKYAAGQIIHSRGDTAAGISIIRSGTAQVGIFGPDGSFIMTSLLGPGHSFGEFTLFTDLPRMRDVIASASVEIYFLSAAQFNRLADRNPDLLRAVLTSTLVRSHLLLQRLDVASHLSIDRRVVHLLLSLTSKRSDTIHYRQSDLASMLGISRVTLNRVLKTLAAARAVQLGYGEIKIIDRQKLASTVPQNDEWLPSL